MAKLSPQEFQAKHNKNTKGAREEMIRGIERVSEAPGVRAAEKAEKMLAGITEAVSSGRWAERVSSVSLGDWKTKMKVKGVPRVSAGLDAAASDIVAFATQLLAHQDGYLPSLHGMPDLTIDDSEARMITNMRAMAGFKRS